MDRRTFLQVSSTSYLLALAGCSTPSKKGEEEEIPVSITQDKESPIDYSVEVVNEDQSEKPYTFELSLTNTSDKQIIYGEARQAVFHGASDKNSPFILLPTGWVEQEYNSSAEVWVSAETYVVTMEYSIGSLDPEETTSEKLMLLHPKTETDEKVQSYPEKLRFSTNLKASPADESEGGGFNIPDSKQYTVELDINTSDLDS